MILLRLFTKLFYVLISLFIVYIVLITYLNSKYNAYLVSKILSKSLPGKFYSERILFSYDFSKIEFNNLYIIAPKGEKVLSIPKMSVELDVIDVIKNVISDMHLKIKSVSIDELNINLIIGENYINIAETFTKLNQKTINDFVYNDLFNNNFLLFGNSGLFYSKSKNESIFKISINDIKVNNASTLLDLNTMRIFVKNFNFNNGSFVLNENGATSRGDVIAQDIDLTLNDKNFKADLVKIYGFEQNEQHLKLNDGYVFYKKSKINLNGFLNMDSFQKMDFKVACDIFVKDVIDLLKQNNIVLPENLKLSDNISIASDITGYSYYPMAFATIGLENGKFDKYQIDKLNIEADYKEELSNLNVYIKTINFNNQDFKRFRLNAHFDNKEIVNLENLSLTLNDSTLKAIGDLNILTGITNYKVEVKKFNPKIIEKLLNLKNLSQFNDFLTGNLNLNLEGNSKNIFEQKGINSKLTLNYLLSKESVFGKSAVFSSMIYYDNKNIIIKPTKLKINEDYVSLGGNIDLKRMTSNISFDVYLSKIGRIFDFLNLKKEADGNFNLSGTIKGSFFNPDLKARFSLNNLNYLQYDDSEIASDISFENGIFQIYGFNIENRDFTAFITTKTQIFEKDINHMLLEPKFSVYVQVSDLKIGNFLQNPDIQMNINSEIDLSGTISDLTGNVSVNSQNIKIFNENFDEFTANIDLNNEYKNIVYLKDFYINKDKQKYFSLDGKFDLKTMDFNLLLFAPRISLKSINSLKNEDKTSLIYGDLIVGGKISGNIKENKIFDYDLAMRFESFKFPYTITETKQKVIKSTELGKQDKIEYIDYKINKFLKLGKGLFTVTGNQEKLSFGGNLFKMLNIEGKIDDLFVTPIFSVSVSLNKFPVHNFYSFPVKSYLSIDTTLKYDITAKNLLDARIIFNDLDVSMGDLKLNIAKRDYKKTDKYCTIIQENTPVKVNCIDYKDNKIILDFGVAFLGQTIMIGGSINELNNFVDIQKNAKLNVNVTGGIDLKSFGYFKDTFTTIDGRALLSARLFGGFENPQYDFNLKITNTSFQPVGFDKEITIEDAVMRVKQNKVQLTNLKGTILGGTFEIKGDSNNLLYDIENNNIFVNVLARNLNYNVPETAEVESNVDLSLTGNIDALKLNGNIEIIDGKYYKSVNIVDKLFVDPLTSKSSVYTEEVNISAIPILKNISLDVDIANKGLTVSNDLMDDVDIKASLHLGGTVGNPILEGRITANEGLVKLLTHRFDLTKFELNFNKTDLMMSDLNFEAESQIKDYISSTGDTLNRIVTLIVKGKLNNLQIELTGEGLDKLQTMTLLLTGQSGADTNSPSSEDAANKITGQLIGLLLQNALGKMTSDFQKQMDIMIQTNVDTEGNLSLSANKMIGKRIMLKGTGAFENNSFEKEVSLQMIIIDQLIIEALKAFEKGKTDLLLKYRLLLK